MVQSAVRLSGLQTEIPLLQQRPPQCVQAKMLCNVTVAFRPPSSYLADESQALILRLPPATKANLYFANRIWLDFVSHGGLRRSV